MSNRRDYTHAVAREPEVVTVRYVFWHTAKEVNAVVTHRVSSFIHNRCRAALEGRWW